MKSNVHPPYPVRVRVVVGSYASCRCWAIRSASGSDLSASEWAWCHWNALCCYMPAVTGGKMCLFSTDVCTVQCRDQKWRTSFHICKMGVQCRFWGETSVCVCAVQGAALPVFMVQVLLCRGNLRTGPSSLWVHRCSRWEKTFNRASRFHIFTVSLRRRNNVHNI